VSQLLRPATEQCEPFYLLARPDAQAHELEHGHASIAIGWRKAKGVDITFAFDLTRPAAPVILFDGTRLDADVFSATVNIAYSAGLF
jgi:hypothetical protein